DERERLFGRLDKAGRDFIEPYIDIYRRQGWAERDPSTEPRTNTISVPVLCRTGRVSATIGSTFFRSSLSEDGKAKLAADLKATAQEILERLRAIPPSASVSERSETERRRK